MYYSAIYIRGCLKEYKQGYYVNLGSWLDSPCYGIFQNNSFEIVDWK